MDNIEFAIAKLKFSKGDFYAVEIIEKFETYQQAEAIYASKNYADSFGGTWQETYEYEIIDIKSNIYYYHNGNKITTVFD